MSYDIKQPKSTIKDNIREIQSNFDKVAKTLMYISIQSASLAKNLKGEK